RRYRQFRAQSCLRKSDRNCSIEVWALTFKVLVFGDADHNIEIAGGTAVASRLAFALDAQARSGLDPRGNLTLHPGFSFDTPGSFAIRARRANHATDTPARMTSTRHGKESLLIPHLPRAGAGAATLGA